MLSRFAKLLLVGTSFAPVLVVISWINAVEGRQVRAISYLVAAILIVIVCILIIKEATRRLEVIPFTPKAAKTADTAILGFVLAYLLPLVNSSGAVIKPEIFWFVLGLLGIVVWTTHSYHVNPLLGLLGYHFYEVTNEGDISFIMITRKSVRHAGQVERVIQLTDYMVLDIGRE